MRRLVVWWYPEGPLSEPRRSRAQAKSQARTRTRSCQGGRAGGRVPLARLEREGQGNRAAKSLYIHGGVHMCTAPALPTNEGTMRSERERNQPPRINHVAVPPCLPFFSPSSESRMEALFCFASLLLGRAATTRPFPPPPPFAPRGRESGASTRREKEAERE